MEDALLDLSFCPARRGCQARKPFSTIMNSQLLFVTVYGNRFTGVSTGAKYFKQRSVTITSGLFFLSLFVLSGVAPLQSGNLKDPLEAGRTLIQFCLLGQKTRGEIILQKSSWKIERYCVKFTLISQVPGLLTWGWIPQPTFLYVKFKSYKNPVFPQCIVSKQVQTVDETLRVVFQIVLRHLLTKY